MWLRNYFEARNSLVVTSRALARKSFTVRGRYDEYLLLGVAFVKLDVCFVDDKVETLKNPNEAVEVALVLIELCFVLQPQRAR